MENKIKHGLKNGLPHSSYQFEWSAWLLIHAADEFR